MTRSPRARRARLAWAATLCLASLSLSGELAAQTPGPRPCFRPRALPRCRDFWLYELEYGRPLATTGRTIQFTFPQPGGVTSFHADDVDHYLVWHLGWMRNRDSLTALGGSFDVGFSGIGSRFGVSARRRRWMPNDLAFEVSAGLAAVNVRGPTEASEHVQRLALTGGVALAHHDLVAVSLRGDVVPGRKTAAAIYAGGELRSTLGVVGTGVGVVLLGLLIRALSSEGY